MLHATACMSSLSYCLIGSSQRSRIVLNIGIESDTKAAARNFFRGGYKSEIHLNLGWILRRLILANNNIFTQLLIEFHL